MKAPNAAERPGLPVGRSLAFGAGGVLDQWGLHGLKNVANPVYNLVLGINPGVVGSVVAISRVWDAFTDPWMGAVSDNARTRWGRRRPFIALGAVMAAVTFPLLWIVPDLVPAGGATVAAILITSLLFYTAFTVFAVPYHALAYEAAPTYDGKTRLLGIRMVFATLSMLGVAWIFPLLQSGWLGTPRESVYVVALGIGAILLVSGLAPAFSLRERPSRNLAGQRAVPLFESLGRALRCRPFLLLLGSAGLTVLALNLINGLGTYVAIYHVFGGDARAAAPVLGAAGTVYVVATLLATPAIVALASRIGKTAAFAVCLGFALVGTCSKWWLFTPDHPWLQIIVNLLLSPGMTGLWMLSESMVADVAESERLRTGEQTEGIYGAVYGWILKSGLALGVFLSGWILVASGFDVTLGPAQDPQTILWLRALFAFLPAMAILGSLALLARYPLSRERMAAIRAQLDAAEATGPSPLQP